MSVQLLTLFILAAAAGLYLARHALGPLLKRSSGGCASGCSGCPSSRACESLGVRKPLEDASREP